MGFGRGFGGCGCGCGGYGYAPVGGYGANWFALVVVLFILLIIVGATVFY